MTNSTVDNVWMQHTKVGAWMDGPMDNFTIQQQPHPGPDRRRRELPHGRHQLHGHQHLRPQHRRRRPGDVGAERAERQATRSPQHGDPADPGQQHRHLRRQRTSPSPTTSWPTPSPTAAACTSPTATRGSTGPATAVSGTITAARNTLIRTGNNDYNWQFGVGAIWFSGLNEPLNAPPSTSPTPTSSTAPTRRSMSSRARRTGCNFTNIASTAPAPTPSRSRRRAQASFSNVTATNIAPAQPDPQLRRRRLRRSPSGAGNSRLVRRPARTARHLAGPDVDQRRRARAAGTAGPTDPPTDPPDRPARPTPTGCNLARNRPVTETSHTDVYAPPTPWTATPTATGRAPTTPSRSPSPWTWAPRERSAGRAQAAAGGRVGDAHPDAERPGQHRQLHVHHTQGLGRVHLRPVERQHRDPHPVRHPHPLSAVSSSRATPAGPRDNSPNSRPTAAELTTGTLLRVPPCSSVPWRPRPGSLARGRGRQGLPSRAGQADGLMSSSVTHRATSAG